MPRERDAMTIRLDSDLARRLRIKAAKEKTSMNRIIERAIQRELENNEREDEAEAEK